MGESGGVDRRGQDGRRPFDLREVPPDLAHLDQGVAVRPPLWARGWYVGWGLLAVGAAGSLGVSAVRDGDAGGAVFVLFFVVLAVVLGCAARQELRLDRAGIVIDNGAWDRSIPWAEIDRIDDRFSLSRGGVRLELRSGRAVLLYVFTAGRADRWVAFVSDAIDEAHRRELPD